jgi:hypothetical protein
VKSLRDVAKPLSAVLCYLLAISLGGLPLPITMTLRNKINLAFILAFSTWSIFAFNLSRAQYVGLFLFLLFAPKAFWLAFDYLTGLAQARRAEHSIEDENETVSELVS